VSNVNNTYLKNQWENVNMLEFAGKMYARVSDVLSPFVDFSAIPPEVLQRKAALGTRVHNAINQDIQGDFPVVGLQDQGYFQSFERWRSALNPVFLTTEKRMYCDEKMLTGCIDALIKLEGHDQHILVDWKTSAAESPITWPMQAMLYWYLLERTGIVVSQTALFIKLDRNGLLPKVYQYKLDSKFLGRCLQAVDDYWEEQNKNKNVALNSPESV
jgi:hypothetical protein